MSIRWVGQQSASILHKTPRLFGGELGFSVSARELTKANHWTFSAQTTLGVALPNDGRGYSLILTTDANTPFDLIHLSLEPPKLLSGVC